MAAQFQKATLTKLVQDLPVELFDEIRELTCTTDAPLDDIVTIDKNYKPPVELQLNRRLREENALVYYRNSAFVIQAGLNIQEFEFPPFAETRMATWKGAKWLKSLPLGYLFRITTIQANTFYGPLQPEGIHTGFTSSRSVIDLIVDEFYTQLFFGALGYNELRHASVRPRSHVGIWVKVDKRVQFSIKTFASLARMEADLNS